MIEWEALCRRCGQCCFEKWVDESGRIHPTRIPCAHLDIVTRECRVYAKRLDMGENCIQLTPQIVSTVTWLPDDCAYVRHLRGLPPQPPKRRGGRRRRGEE